MTQVLLSNEADADIRDAQAYYDSISEGLGDYFCSSLLADLDRLTITAGVHRKAHRHYHRALCRDFPYGIFYTFDEGKVVIWAVVDLRRDTEWINEHLAALRP